MSLSYPGTNSKISEPNKWESSTPTERQKPCISWTTQHGELDVLWWVMVILLMIQMLTEIIQQRVVWSGWYRPGQGGGETTYAALFILWRISKNSPSDLATRWRTRSCHGRAWWRRSSKHNEVCVEIHKLSADENMFKTFSSSSKTSLFAATSSKMSNALCLFSLRGSVCPVDCFPGWQGQAGPPSSLPVCPTHARLDGCIQHKCEPARQANSSEIAARNFLNKKDALWSNYSEWLDTIGPAFECSDRMGVIYFLIKIILIRRN